MTCCDAHFSPPNLKQDHLTELRFSILSVPKGSYRVKHGTTETADNRR
jgi:hypothetical protein